MTDLDDLDLRSAEADSPGSSPRAPGPPFGWIAGLSALVVVAAGLALWLSKKPPQAAPPAAASAAPAVTDQPTPAPTPQVSLPPLDESDALLRQLAAGLSAHPSFAQWLGVPKLVRTLAAATVNIAEGVSPRPHLGFLAPSGGFGVLRKPGGLAIDPSSYRRYDTFAGVLASLDGRACARVYLQVEPLFDQAYRELGYPSDSFRPVLEQAVGRLLETPLLEGDVAVRLEPRARLVYELVEPRLEALSAPQKHLLRMGAANVRRIQQTLRAFSAGLTSGAP